MTVATAGAIAIGAAEEATVVIFLFAIGELLETVTAGRARAGIKALINLVPRTAGSKRPAKFGRCRLSACGWATLPWFVQVTGCLPTVA